MAHIELGYELMRKIKAEIEELSVVESPAKLQGRNMMMIVAPSAKK